MLPLKVFISAPYTIGDVIVNSRNAILAGDEVAGLGHIPFIPHLNIQWHMVCPHEPDFWYEYDLKWLDVCDVILRLPGESWGADREVQYAESKGIKVIYGINEL